MSSAMRKYAFCKQLHFYIKEIRQLSDNLRFLATISYIAKFSGIEIILLTVKPSIYILTLIASHKIVSVGVKLQTMVSASALKTT